MTVQGHKRQNASKTTAAEQKACALNRSHRKEYALAVMLVGASLGLLSLLPTQPRFVWNITESVPLGLYAVEHRTPLRGELAVISPEETLSALLHAQHALAPGRVLIKPLAALQGDIVCRTGVIITINGDVAGRAHKLSSSGKELPNWQGCRRLTQQEVFVVADHPSSFDSRYFGPIDARQLIGVARPLLTSQARPGGL